MESGEIKLVVAKNDIVYVVKNTVLPYESLSFDKNITIMFNGYAINEVTTYEKIAAYFNQEKLKKFG